MSRHSGVSSTTHCNLEKKCFGTVNQKRESCFFLPNDAKREAKEMKRKNCRKFREEGGTNNMRLRDRCFEEIVLNLFSILLLEARL